ncbi:hypothetical protein RA178_03190 [Shewanella oncorhynchi]|uniref:Uncharacterized protein n=1 Tax=Shewanella oncorhynchi TaxID=2726434 RepID=A0AA50Q725_9GAMM|nr:hypothetical protein [Shewanella oncorhynchi]WMB73643.1 hypothetical protein RA178_03190 [Shewanella oncorhynchi]
MSKIISAANVMITNRHLITDVIEANSSSEIFFRYKTRYIWSITRSQDKIFLHFYPNAHNTESLAELEPYEWQDYSPIISYNSVELGTKEAKSTFEELQLVVKEKLLNMDKVLDDIIGDFF